MSDNITALLKGATEGDQAAADRLFLVIYDELRIIAKSHRRRWVGDETLNTTALIHEAFVKLDGQVHWNSRTHFYATAAKAMRHILVNYAEKKRAGKRGGGVADLPLDEVLLVSDEAADDALELHQALEELEKDRPRLCRIVECRFFGGMSIEETAQALDISPATVGRDWRLASSWLFQRLGDKSAGPK